MEKNPDYFKNRSEYIREWRDKNPDYQRQWRSKHREKQDLDSNVSPLKSIRFITPVILQKNEIKDLVMHVTIVKTKSYKMVEGVGVKQDTIGYFS